MAAGVVDDPEIEDFTPITTAITQRQAASRVLVAYHSKQYPNRRAGQWELTAAYLAATRRRRPAHVNSATCREEKCVAPYKFSVLP